MKIFFVYTLFYCYSASAINLPILIGDYRFDETQLHVTKAQHTVRLVVLNEEGKKLLQSYKTNAYICTAAPSSQFTCHKFVNDFPLPVTVRAQVLSEMGSSVLSFQKPASEPELVNDSPMLKEWDVLQLSRYQNEKFVKTHYYQVENFLKLSLINEKNEKTYFFFEDEKILAQISKTADLEKTSEYQIQNFVLFNITVQWDRVAAN